MAEEKFAVEAAVKDKRVQEMAYSDARLSVKTMTESVAFQPKTAVKEGSKETEVASNVKQNIELSSKQIEDKIELAGAAYLNAFDGGDKEQLLSAQEILNQAQFEKQRIEEARNAFFLINQ